jgi:hypothetical protein
MSTSFFTAPGFNHSSIYTSFITRPRPTFTTTAPGAKTTTTEYAPEILPEATFTAPGGSVTYTQLATTTLAGATITSLVFQPGENSTITSIETTTCDETVSTCSASPISPVSPSRETTIYTTNYVTQTIATAYTAAATCSDKTITITVSAGDWDAPGTYVPHTWSDKSSGHGGATTTSGRSWRRM